MFLNNKEQGHEAEEVDRGLQGQENQAGCRRVTSFHRADVPNGKFLIPVPLGWTWTELANGQAVEVSGSPLTQLRRGVDVRFTFRFASKDGVWLDHLCYQRVDRTFANGSKTSNGGRARTDTILAFLAARAP